MFEERAGKVAPVERRAPIASATTGLGRFLGAHNGGLRCEKARRTALRHREIIRSQTTDRRSDRAPGQVFHPVHSADSACRDTHDLREKDYDAKYTEEGLLATLCAVNVPEHGWERGMSEITRNVRKILMFFGVAFLKEPFHHAEYSMCRSILSTPLGGLIERLIWSVSGSVIHYRTNGFFGYSCFYVKRSRHWVTNRRLFLGQRVRRYYPFEGVGLCHVLNPALFGFIFF